MLLSCYWVKTAYPQLPEGGSIAPEVTLQTRTVKSEPPPLSNSGSAVSPLEKFVDGWRNSMSLACLPEIVTVWLTQLEPGDTRHIDYDRAAQLGDIGQPQAVVLDLELETDPSARSPFETAPPLSVGLG